MAALGSQFFRTKPFYCTQILKCSLQFSKPIKLSRSFYSINRHAFFTSSYQNVRGTLLGHRATPLLFNSAHINTLKDSHGSILEEKTTTEEKSNGNESNKKSYKFMKVSLIIFGVTTTTACLLMLYEINKPLYDADGTLIEDEFSHMPYLQQLYYRVKKEMTYYKKLVQEPSREKLLPDPVKYPYIQPPYTIILESTDVLVHPDWTYQTGWRFKKRPGVDAFLEAIAPPLFEIVVYTAEQKMTFAPILEALDPNNYMHKLFRDATRFVDGHHVKDLDAVNRDLSKVIVIDWNAESVKLHPQNMFKIPRWNGNDDDTTLYDLAAFLKTIYSTNVEDVREVLNYYQQFDDPIEIFKENQRKLLDQLQQEESLMHNKENKFIGSKWTPSFLKS